MLHRLVATCIVAFWIAMTTLLVIQQMYPESANINAVPLPFVGKLIFQHQQASDLQIYDKEKNVGHMYLQPRLDATTGARVLDMTGNLVSTLPGMSGQRIGWVANITLDDSFAPKQIHLSISFQAPEQQIMLDITPATKEVRYILRNGATVIERNTMTLDEKGIGALLGQVGLSPAMFAQLPANPDTQFAPKFSAQQSSVKINGETASTYLLSMKVADQPFIEAHVSQLGQVLKASMPLLGYRLAPQNVEP